MEGIESDVENQVFVAPNIEKIDEGNGPVEGVVKKAKDLGLNVPSGQGLDLSQIKNLYGENDYFEKKRLYGDRIAKGSTAEVFLDRKTGIITKIFEPNLTEAQIKKNAEQIGIYKNNNGKQESLTFVREIPGGWQQKYLVNDGDILGLATSDQPPITDQEIDQAINDVIQLAEITGCAHGDLVKHPGEVGDWQRELLRKQFEVVEQTGYINFQNVLFRKELGGTRKLLFLDWDGASDPITIGGTVDTKDKRFIEGEIKLFGDGLKNIQSKMTNRQSEINNP
ncbi:MAG: hypothetical protein ABSC49_01080 [Candidatus Microgenomates bacterium]|jgi:hypothetical protein